MRVWFLMLSYCCFLHSFDGLKEFNFITVLYNETNQQRINEYKECLNRNLKHPFIKTVCVVYDTSRDRNSQQLPLLNFIRSKKVRIEFVNKRPTYDYLFKLADKIFPNTYIIISNADIYFNETLMLLNDYDFTNKFIALTRWNLDSNGNLGLQYNHGKPGIGSQDAWIYKAPLPHFECNNIEIGTGYCDSCVMYQAHKAGLDVINPCLSIQCCHMHASKSRPNFKLCNAPKGYYVPWTELE